VHAPAFVGVAAGGVAAQHAAVAGRVRELDREQREVAFTCRCEQRVRGRRRDQRNVAVEDQRDARVVQQRHRLQHGVPGAELRLLADERESGRCNARFDTLGAVAGDRDDAVGAEPGGGVENMLQ